MLCDKCHEREAHIQVTSVINGISDTKHLCEQCAAAAFPNMRPDKINPDNMNEWSKAIFKLISDSVMKAGKNQEISDQQEEMKNIACPNCGKTYGEFLEDGIFGCSGCYDVFGPFLPNIVKGLQGADSHVGKKVVKASNPSKEFSSILKGGSKSSVKAEQVKASGAKPAASESLSSRIQHLKDKMNEAAQIEDYASAAAYRDEIKKLEAKMEEESQKKGETQKEGDAHE